MYAQDNILCQFGLFRHKFTTVSPPILNHFWWELYHRRKDLTPEQKREVLGYLMFLKKKRCGKIKGRGCADGRKQRAYITKEQSTSPTISTEAVFLTALVDAWESRKVTELNVPGAFMQVDMDELVHVRFRGEMVDKLLEIDPELYSS